MAEAGVHSVRLDLLIKLALGHTVGDIAGVYTDATKDLELMFRKYHYLIPLVWEEAFDKEKGWATISKLSRFVWVQICKLEAYGKGFAKSGGNYPYAEKGLSAESSGL